MTRFAFLAIAVCFLAVSLASGDQVSLKNGDRLTGTIVKSDGKALTLHTDYAGDLSLKWDAVAGIQSGEPLHVQLENGKTLAGAVTTSDGKLQIATKSGEVEEPISEVKGLRNDAEETAYEKTLHPGLLQGWKSGLSAGFALTRGNSATKNLSLAFTAARQTTTDKLSLYENSVYASNDAVGAVPHTTANTAGGGASYDHDLNKKVFGFVAGDFFADELQGLNLRSVFGGGAGYHAIKSDLTTLDLLAGLNYTHESYTTFSRNFAALTLGEQLMHKLGKSTALNEEAMIYPNINSPGDYRATINFATVTKMTKRLGWQNGFSDIYVTNPPTGKKKNDLVFTTGLNVSFGE